MAEIVAFILRCKCGATLITAADKAHKKCITCRCREILKDAGISTVELKHD